MKKIIIILFILLFASFSFSRVLHCFDITGGLDTSPSASWSAGHATAADVNINGNIYDQIILPGASLTVSNFGYYNFLCDNGWRTRVKTFHYTQIIDDEGIKKGVITNGPGVAKDYGRKYCETNNGRKVFGSNIGIGTIDEYNFNFSTAAEDIIKWVGGHDYETFVATKPVAGQLDTGPKKLKDSASGSFYFTPNPVLLVFGGENEKIGFYEKNGEYVKNVFFTLSSKSILQLRIDDYNIECENANCSIDQEIKGYTINRNGNIILKGEITIDKDDIPKDIFYKLNVHYAIPELEAFDRYKDGFDISSDFSEINVGYLDQQDFQIEIIGKSDQQSCIGLDGMIGQTGEIVAPRINVGFGGDDELITDDECYNDDGNWVYCSQREFMVRLTNQIKDLFDVELQLIQGTGDTDTLLTKKSELQSFRANVRDLDLSSERNDDLADAFSQEIFANNLSAIGDGATQTVPRLKNLFDNISFTYSNGLLNQDKFSVGEYDIKINLNITNDITSGEIVLTQTDLFDQNNNLNNGLSNIIVDLNPTGNRPLVDWFFYDNAIEDINADSINITESSFYSTNINNRGVVLDFEHKDGQENMDNATLYKSFAHPLFVRVDSSDLNTNKFTLLNSNIITGDWPANVFSYWTGFASNINGELCKELKKDEDAMLYRTPDFFNVIDKEFEIYNTTVLTELNDGEEYLETVIIAPVGDSVDAERFSIKGNGNIYNKDGLCTDDCGVQIDSSNSESVRTLQEVFDGIRDRKICVNNSLNDNITKWTIFWNENEILKEIYETKINSIAPNELCG